MKIIKLITITIMFFILTSFISCAQWRVSKLKPNKISTLPVGNKPGQVMLVTDDSGLQVLTLNVGVFNNKICTIDNELYRIQIIEPGVGPKLIIGDVNKIKSPGVKTVKFNFSVIGTFTMDGEDNIYVQNRIYKPQSYRNRKFRNNEELSFSPSYVLVFNKDGVLQYTLGQKGSTDLPFYHIETLFVDSEGRLFIISRYFDTWRVFRFIGKKRDFYFNLGELQFTEKDGEDYFKGKIENVKIYQSGNKLLISVAYYHGKRLKYRKVYDFSVENSKINKELVKIPDPKNVLFNIVNDKYMYFWNMDNSNVKFMITNLDGTIISNIMLVMSLRKSYYTDIIGDSSGKLYSYDVTKKGIDIFEWE